MPHIDVKYKSDHFEESDLVEIANAALDVISCAYQEVPEFISVDFTPQSKFAMNRKDIDLEVWSSRGVNGSRVPITESVAEDCAQKIGSIIEKMRPNKQLSASVWVRVFEVDHYALWRNEHS